jgi:hypothetical protein
MMTNQTTKCPFQPGIMITDPNRFWGRNSERLTIISRLQNMGSSVITGSRRIGKSSLAYFVFIFCKSNLPDCETVWVDCQDIGIKTVDGFFRQISVGSSLNYISGQTKDECLQQFANAIVSGGKKFILFVDEFELLTDAKHKKQFDLSFFMQLRMLAGQGGKLALVLVSRKPLQEICKHVLEVSSPFYNIFAAIPLSVFTEEEVSSFLKSKHEGFKFSKKEMEFIKQIEDYCHPLVLQVASETIFINRSAREDIYVLERRISEQKNNYLNHDEVQKERDKEKEMTKRKKEKKIAISKPLDLLISILIPVLGIGLIILEFGWLIQYLSNFKSVLLAVFSTLVGMVILIFAGLSINLIGETTFFKLYTRIIEQIPLFSNLLDFITSKIRKSN